jgi:hypothetical protein
MSCRCSGAKASATSRPSTGSWTSTSPQTGVAVELELRRDRVEHRPGLAGQRDDRARAVLGLGEQVGRDEPRIGVVGGDDEDVARAEEAVDADVARDEPLGLLDVERARPAMTSARATVSVP